MTNRFKDFGAGGDGVNKDPLSFKLYDEEFHCRPAIQGKVLLDMVSGAEEGELGSGAAKVINDFFSTVLLDESYERFDTLLQDPEKIVTVETLGEITAWLVEEYTGRPTQQPEPSLSGQ
jgi:hypothetical protein